MASQNMSAECKEQPDTLGTRDSNDADILERCEEETLPNFDSSWSYPVKIGERIADQYQILGKLGYGVTSTVWYVRDDR